jgi:hypothetical protein
MNKKIIRNKRLCYSLYCPPGSLPFYTVLGVMLTGFLTIFLFNNMLDYVYVITGEMPTLCIGGFRIHHLYVGIILSITTFIGVYLTKNPKAQLVWVYFLGIAFGLIISDLIVHLMFQSYGFELYCE